MIIDMHAHTSRHPMKGLYTSDATLENLEHIAYRMCIKKIVLMATYFPYKGTGLSNRDLRVRIENCSLFTMFGSLDVMNNYKEGLRELENFARFNWMSGIKLYPGYQNFTLQDVPEIYELAEEFRLPVAIHTGELHHCCPKELRLAGKGKCGSVCMLDVLANNAHPSALQGVAKKYPKVNFIMCHLGNPFFESAKDVMRECPNVYADISGQFVTGTEDAKSAPLVLEEIKSFLQIPGVDQRLMFGTDFPIQSYSDTVDLVENLGTSLETVENIYCRNAMKLLGGHI